MLASGNRDNQPIQLVRQDDLAAEPAMRRQIVDELKHIRLAPLRRLRQFLGPGRLYDDMAGPASELTTAVSIYTWHPAAGRDQHETDAVFGFDRNFLTVTRDERNLGHGSIPFLSGACHFQILTGILM